MHIFLGDERDAKLKKYAEDRKISKSKALKIGFDRLTATEYPNIEQETTVRLALSQYFAVPTMFAYKAFFTFLGMLAQHSSKASSKSFWGDLIYLSEIDRSHEEIYIEIVDEMKRIRKRNALTSADSPSQG